MGKMNREQKKKALIFSGIAGLIGLIYYFDLMHYVTLENIKLESERLKSLVARHYHASVLVYMAIFIAFLMIGILPTTIPLVLLSGYLFGAFWGGLYATVAATIGSAFSFLLFRYCMQGAVKRKCEEKLGYFKKQIDAHGSAYLLVLHYTSVVPFIVIKMLAAVSPISLGKLMAISFIGALPSYFIFASAGRNLSTIHTARDIFSPSVILALCLLVAMASASIVVRIIRERRHRNQ
jgi:uncharacterized membrane protein YdjX (TVP38/TMEM64 family)